VWDSPCQSALNRPSCASCFGKIRKLVVATRPRHFGQNQRGDYRCGHSSTSNHPPRPSTRRLGGFVANGHSRCNCVSQAQRLGYERTALVTRSEMSLELGGGTGVEPLLDIGCQQICARTARPDRPAHG
jgi:hypothetical protein